MKMQTIDGPKQVKFDADGVTHEGLFLGTEHRTIEETDDEGRKLGTKKDVLVYSFAGFDADKEKATGRDFEFLGAADLRKKLSPALIGRFVSVTRTDDRIQTGSGKMVVFKVQASEENFVR